MHAAVCASQLFIVGHGVPWTHYIIMLSLILHCISDKPSLAVRGDGRRGVQNGVKDRIRVIPIHTP